LTFDRIMSSSSLRVGVIGPAGFGGSYLCVELLNRGHTVFGISRNPEKLGKHPRYVPRPVDIDEVSTEDLAKQFEGIDVLVSEFGPHTAGAGALLYSMPSIDHGHVQKVTDARQCRSWNPLGRFS
jgi:putative NADH-flavin reductase